MPTKDSSDAKFEIGYVLFIDIVGYSTLRLNEQRNAIEALNRVVREASEFQTADKKGKLVRLPTGDGMALVFHTSPEDPVECAIEISRGLKGRSEFKVRMGVHSGPVGSVLDVNERANIAGAGINTAQRVMDCGDAGHILISKRAAEDLEHSGNWQQYLHDLGDCEVKHGVRVSLVNLWTDDAGNPEVPSKIKQAREQEAANHRLQVIRRRKRFGAIAAAVLVIAAGTAFWFLRPNVSAKSVAVLPFENLSADKENAFLASGLQDEIITQLAKIGSLKVISRASTMQYESKPKSVAKIAAELGVAAILEGSVEKVGNSVRVNVQLIKASTDTHLWAEKYDRVLIDMLKVQSEIAQQVATALSATLTAEERARIDQKATSNPEAYALYLKGTEVLRRPAVAASLMEEGQHYFEQAVALDPNFALAYARLAQLHTRIAIFYDPSPLHKERGRSAAEEALRLQPTLSEGHVALGLYYGRLAREYDAALREYELAKQGAPNDVYILYGIAHVQMKRGQFRAAIANWERATSLDPMNWNMFDNLSNAYGAVGMFAAAERAARREVELLTGPSPEKFGLEQHWAWFYLELTGSFEKLDEVIARNATTEDPNGYIAMIRFDVRMAERNYADAESAIAQSPTTIFEQFSGPRVTKNFRLGIVAMVQGDMAKARPLFEADLQFARTELNEAPDSEARHAQLGLVCAYLGRKEEAIAEGRRAVELMPISKDALDGPGYIMNLAEIYGRVGEPDEAINLLEQSLKKPGGLSLTDLKLGWQWDPLRNNPRFQKLLEGPPPKVIYE